MAEAGDPLLGAIIDGRYRIDQRIGDGGMGVVYRASHVILQKLFAIKVLRPELARDPEVVQRFVQEAKAASAIGHPNIVNINDFGQTEDGSVYLAMEFLVGQTLAQAMAAGPLLYPRALDLFVQISAALDATHAHDIVHRDLKPENVFLKREGRDPDVVKVLDFGIAKVRNAAAKLTRTGMVFGTPHYMSPEQAAGQPVDHRSDIYSLGVIMYQTLAGQLPFIAESFMEIVTKHMYEPPAALSAGTHALPPALEALVMQCLAKKPEDRPQSMREVQAVLQRVQVLAPASEPALPRSVPAPELERRPQLQAVHPTGGTTLAAAAEHVISDDDERVSLPRLRVPRWLWIAAVVLIAGLAALSLRTPAPPAAATPSAITSPVTLAPAASAAPEPAPALAPPAPAVMMAEPVAEEPEPAAKPAQKSHPARGPNKPVSARRHDSVPTVPAGAARPSSPSSELADPWK